jgi:hypothetical protein
MTVLGFIPSCLLIALLGLLIGRGVNRTLPAFFIYVGFAVIADLARFAVRNHAAAYYGTYYITEAGYDLLGILVMYEAMRSVLAGLGQARWGRVAFPAVVLAAVLLSLARVSAAPDQFSRRMAFFILRGEVAARFVQVMVFAGLVTLVPLLGMRWRQHSFGVATGFGLYSTVMLLTTVKFSDFGTSFTFLWGLTSLVAYSVTVIIWIWFFAVAQKSDTPNSGLPIPPPGDLTRYKDVLKRMR